MAQLTADGAAASRNIISSEGAAVSSRFLLNCLAIAIGVTFVELPFRQRAAQIAERQSGNTRHTDVIGRCDGLHDSVTARMRHLNERHESHQIPPTPGITADLLLVHYTPQRGALQDRR